MDKPTSGQKQIPHNLSVRAQSFVDREEEIHKATQALLDPHIPIVIVTGLGGIGKTALALEVAYHLLEQGQFAGGICWLNCRGSDNTLDAILHTIQATFGLAPAPTLYEGVRRYLRTHPCLLILDGYEAVAQEMEILAFLERLPKLSKALLTSREDIRLHGRSWTLSLAGLTTQDAVHLFVEAAKRYDLKVLPEQASLVAEICQFLDGIPLAIHSAAAIAPNKGLAALQQAPGGLRRADDLLALARDETRGTEVRRWAAEALRGLGWVDEAASVLLALVRNGTVDAEAREQAAEALVGLAPHLPEPLLWGALAAARKIQSERRRAEALVGLAPHLPEPLLREALAAAREIEYEDDRAEALVGLAPHLPEAERAEVLREALAAVREVRAEHLRAKALSALAPHLPGDLFAPEPLEADRWPPRLAYLVHLSIRYEQDENWAAAIDVYRQARALLDPNKGEEELRRYTELGFRLGLCLKQDGRWSEALEQQEENVVGYKKLGNPYGKASAYLEMGHIYQMMNIYDLALLYYGEAYYLYQQAAEEARDEAAHQLAQRGMADAKEALGDLEFQLKVLPQALTDLEEAVKLYITLDMPGKAAIIRQTLERAQVPAGGVYG